jgi:hypothetical protein
VFISGLVFLQYSDEVKRALLPAELNSISDIKALFTRSFAGLGQDYLDSPHVKIYIQEPGKSELFYELDDLRYVSAVCASSADTVLGAWARGRLQFVCTIVQSFADTVRWREHTKESFNLVVRIEVTFQSNVLHFGD